VLQVEAKEEKLAVYEGRSASGANGETSQSAEEQLQVTVADLRYVSALPLHLEHD
jgi:hypothetical protein